jgi:mono/diheme cytochrome c family protein
MKSLLRLISFLAFTPAVAVCFGAQAAEPTLTIIRDGTTRTFELSALLKHKAITSIKTDDGDEAYKRPMEYVAIPIEALIGDLSNDAEATLQFVALDGYAPVIAGKRLPKSGAARAYLAIEPSPGAWPPLGPNKASPGPFYLVWTDAAGSGVTPAEWPWQLATIRVQESVAHRFPAIAPDKSVREDNKIWAGFEVYSKQCLACHTINKQGDAALGPDLNMPLNPLEYLTEPALRKLVRDPKSVRDWPGSAMPGFDAIRVSDAELDNLIVYLRYMTARKIPLN